ncbi:LemA family protein [Brevundimonas halotolerans]|uniref:LemA protein n=1 Tax=Brevundimonas halotolerans TaxID=69670 RepID=A0A7W9A0R3_9CAUL|nr:LemA family protein [Brevundimonas halotolerans]MBB5659294.1 LemA protein [Brevundimonas halotolerans]
MTILRTPVLAVAAVTLTLGGCGYNTIPTQEEAARTKWADVEAQYQRRADLIPNLVATVQGASIAERETLTGVIEARSRATSIQLDADALSDPAAVARYQAAQGELSQALSRLMLVVEQYPQIQSNANFIALQSQLEGTENRIAVARRDYNEAARVYNTTLRTFPGNIWASTFHSGSEPLPLFTASPGAETAPQVQFNTGATPAQ